MSASSKQPNVNDTELVGLFQQRLSRLFGTQFAKEVETGKFNAITLVSYRDETTGLDFASAHPDGLDAFILHYRVLTQDNDPMSLRNMGPVIKRATDATTFSRFNEACKKLNRYLDAAAGYNPGNVIKTEREFVEVFLYGVHAHTDLPKYIKFREMAAADAIINKTYRGKGDSLAGMFLYSLQNILIRLKEIELAFTSGPRDSLASAATFSRRATMEMPPVAKPARK